MQSMNPILIKRYGKEFSILKTTRLSCLQNNLLKDVSSNFIKFLTLTFIGDYFFSKFRLKKNLAFTITSFIHKINILTSYITKLVIF